jgi:hypothetical protein
MNRLTIAGAIFASGLALSGAGCRGRGTPAPAGSGVSPAPPLVEPAGPADETVAATVQRVLETARHPWIRWPDLADVAPALRDIYGGEADRLFWFAGERPYPALAGAIEAVAGAAERALVPADYDSARIEAESKRLQAPPPVGGADRALFDLAVSVAVLGDRTVHHGRVDPRTLGWG